MMRFFLFIFGLMSFSGFSQEMISLDFEVEYSIEEIRRDFGIIDADFAVRVYVASYTTIGTDGNPDTAGAAVALPVNPDGAPFLIYHHGTVNNRFDVPSLGASESDVVIGFAAYGFCAFAPDYIGMSSSRGYHPYLHVETQARASIDLILAMEEYLDNVDYDYTKSMFLTGYSQGGHASASTQFVMQNNPVSDFEVVAASHMSGPYDLSETMFYGLLSDDPYTAVAYLPHTILGLHEVYGNLFSELEDVFKAPYASIIAELYNDAALFTINGQLITQLIVNEGKIVPKLMLQDSVVTNLLANPNHPIRRALLANDLKNWVPECPTKLLYCTADEQVNYRNAVVTDSIMNALGALDVESIDVASSQSHGGCVRPAFIVTYDFFRSFIKVNNEEIEEDDTEQFTIRESANGIFVESNDITNATISLFNLQGQLVEKLEMMNETKIFIPLFKSGMYYVKIQTQGGYFTLPTGFMK